MRSSKNWRVVSATATETVLLEIGQFIYFSLSTHDDDENDNEDVEDDDNESHFSISLTSWIHDMTRVSEFHAMDFLRTKLRFLSNAIPSSCNHPSLDSASEDNVPIYITRLERVGHACWSSSTPRRAVRLFSQQ